MHYLKISTDKLYAIDSASSAERVRGKLRCPAMQNGSDIRHEVGGSKL